MKMPSKTFAFLAIFFCVPAVYARDNANVFETKILITGLSKVDGKWLEKEGTIKDFSKSIGTMEIEVVSPHPFLNPKKEKTKWKGIGLRDLIKTLGFELKQGEYVSVVGEDFYVTQLRAEDVKKFPIIIAFAENGVPLEKEKGEIQTIFPTEMPGLPKDYFHDSFWCWYVRKIVVGKEPSRFRIFLNSKSKNLDLTAIKAAPSTGIFLKPRGGHIQLHKDGLEQYGYPLKDILSLINRSENSPITLKDFLGRSKNITSLPISPDKLFLVTQTNGSVPLPTYLGGPAILTHKEPQDKMVPLFFIESIFMGNPQ